ncbi:MAG: signal peptidase I [Pseudoxanthomonas sp.]|nr:signal peptidase I [Pseudoxanthomonas sp.]
MSCKRADAMILRLPRVLNDHRGLLLFLALMLCVRAAVADFNDVPSASMHPTIVEGDRVLVNRLAYDLKLPLAGIVLARLGEPARGDVVVFRSTAAGTRLIKRVVGLPGETVALRDNRLYVDGLAADYDLVGQGADGGVLASERLGAMRHGIRLAPRPAPVAWFGPVTVPADHYLVLGDYRDNSADSRSYGLVPRAELSGRAERVLFSLDYGRWLRPRPERFWLSLDGSPPT